MAFESINGIADISRSSISNYPEVSVSLASMGLLLAGGREGRAGRGREAGEQEPAGGG